MSFCTSCGNAMAEGSTICTKCGAKMAPVQGGASASAPVAAPAKSGGALKVILIVLGVIMVLCVAAGIGGIIFVRHVVKKASVHTDSKGNTSATIPGLGSVQTLKDSREVAEKMGVDVYPGAEVVNNQATSMTIGGMTTAHAMFTSDASVDDVFSFYKQKYPDANVTSEQGNDERTLVRGSEDNELLTIQVRREDEKTTIHITRITKGKP